MSGILGAWGQQRAHVGSVDGINGISRRGTYDRLLLSEWLLHDEIPDEFMRRVVSHEHSFLDRAFKQESITRHCLVLFDAGVEQLGGPRIVQLAGLIALAQRAETAGATLSWGVLQEGSCTLQSDVTKANVTELMRARCTMRPSLADLDRWHAVVSATKHSELWLVGSASLGDEASKRRAWHLEVSELLEPRASDASERVVVRAIVPKASKAREVTLELPPPRTSVQLLRDPFSMAVVMRMVTKTSIDPATNFVFSRDGRMLFVRGSEGTLLTFQIPNSPRAKASAPAVFAPPDEHRILAVGRSRSNRKTFLVTRCGDAMFVHVHSKRGGQSREPIRISLPADYPGHVEGKLASLATPAEGQTCFVDPHGNLVHVAHNVFGIEDTACVSESKVVHSGLVYITASAGRRALVTARVSDDGVFRKIQSTIDLSGVSLDFHAFLGAPESHQLVAYARSASSWTVVRNDQCMKWHVPEGRKVVGVIERGHAPTEVLLVTLDASRMHIRLHGRELKGGSVVLETIVTTVSPIVHVAASGLSPVVAYLTESGELCVYSVLQKAVVLRVAPEAP